MVRVKVGTEAMHAQRDEPRGEWTGWGWLNEKGGDSAGDAYLKAVGDFVIRKTQMVELGWQQMRSGFYM